MILPSYLFYFFVCHTCFESVNTVNLLLVSIGFYKNASAEIIQGATCKIYDAIIALIVLVLMKATKSKFE
jgi:hypothetical protein